MKHWSTRRANKATILVFLWMPVFSFRLSSTCTLQYQLESGMWQDTMKIYERTWLKFGKNWFVGPNQVTKCSSEKQVRCRKVTHILCQSEHTPRSNFGQPDASPSSSNSLEEERRCWIFNGMISCFESLFSSCCNHFVMFLPILLKLTNI